jgi:hypothetical protein
MDFKYIHASVIFFVGFMLGYLLNNSSDEEANAAFETNFNTDQGLAQAPKIDNPFRLQTPQSKRIEQTKTLKARDSVENEVIKLGIFSSALSLEEPYSDEEIESKLATIGFLISDNETEQLASNLGNGSAHIRKQTMLGLGDINSDDALRIVGQALMSDPLAENRIVAVSILEKSVHLEFVEYLLTHTMQNDSEHLVRQSAAQALGIEAHTK